MRSLPRPLVKVSPYPGLRVKMARKKQAKVSRERRSKGPAMPCLDLKDIGVKQLNISNVAARQELRDLMKALNLPGVSVDF